MTISYCCDTEWSDAAWKLRRRLLPLPALAPLKATPSSPFLKAKDGTLAGSFLLVSNFLINPSTILIGGLAVASGLSFWATILSSTLGIVVAFAAYIVMATVGVDYGITGQVACRMVFGIRGAKWLPSVMRTMLPHTGSRCRPLWAPR